MLNTSSLRRLITVLRKAVANPLEDGSRPACKDKLPRRSLTPRCKAAVDPPSPPSHGPHCVQDAVPRSARSCTWAPHQTPSEPQSAAICVRRSCCTSNITAFQLDIRSEEILQRRKTDPGGSASSFSVAFDTRYSGCCPFPACILAKPVKRLDLVVECARGL